MSLMPDPDLILLDEATSGINPTLIEAIKDRIRELNEKHGKTFLLIEHNIQFIGDLCSRVFVLNYGQKLSEGTPDEIMNDEAVIEEQRPFEHGCGRSCGHEREGSGK